MEGWNRKRGIHMSCVLCACSMEASFIIIATGAVVHFTHVSPGKRVLGCGRTQVQDPFLPHLVRWGGTFCAVVEMDVIAILLAIARGEFCFVPCFVPCSAGYVFHDGVLLVSRAVPCRADYGAGKVYRHKTAHKCI